MLYIICYISYAAYDMQYMTIYRQHTYTYSSVFSMVIVISFNFNPQLTLIIPFFVGFGQKNVKALFDGVEEERSKKGSKQNSLPLNK